MASRTDTAVAYVHGFGFVGKASHPLIVTGPGTNMCSELNTTLTLLVTGVPEILKQKIVEERLVDLSFLIFKYITSLSINVGYLQVRETGPSHLVVAFARFPCILIRTKPTIDCSF